MQVALDLVSPDLHYGPSLALQLGQYPTPPSSVVPDLTCPEVRVSLRSDIASRTAMPEAPIHEDCDPLTLQAQIRPSWDASQVGPVAYSELPKRAPEPQLWRRVEVSNGSHPGGGLHRPLRPGGYPVNGRSYPTASR
jgi:hypothetical protein